jgi:hypothetical protein
MNGSLQLHEYPGGLVRLSCEKIREGQYRKIESDCALHATGETGLDYPPDSPAAFSESTRAILEGHWTRKT